MTPEEFIQKIKELEPQPEKSLDFILGTLDDSYWEGNFDFANRVMKEICLEDFNTRTFIGLLSYTFVVKDKLPEYSRFVKRISKILEEREPYRVKELLSGLGL